MRGVKLAKWKKLLKNFSILSFLPDHIYDFLAVSQINLNAWRYPGYVQGDRMIEKMGM